MSGLIYIFGVLFIMVLLLSLLIISLVQSIVYESVLNVQYYFEFQCYGFTLMGDDGKYSITKHSIYIIYHVLLHCRQRAPVGIALPSSGTSQLCMFDIQATTKSKYCDHIVLLYLESRRCRYRSIILFVFIYMFLWLS